MNDLPANSERDERIKAILEHPLESEQDWREVARLIDDDAAEKLTTDKREGYK